MGFFRLGVQNSVTNTVHIGYVSLKAEQLIVADRLRGNSFALFLKSQRKWENPPLQDDHRDMFHANCKEHKYEAAKCVFCPIRI